MRLEVEAVTSHHFLETPDMPNSPQCSSERAEHNGPHVFKLCGIMFRDLSASDVTEASWWHINNSFPVPLIRTSSEHKQALIEKKKDNDS